MKLAESDPSNVSYVGQSVAADALRLLLLISSVSSVKRMEPFDPEHPDDFHIIYETANGTQKTHLSVDTEQSAMQWRRAFEGALFRHATSQWKSKQAAKHGVEHTDEDKEKWTTLRACIPLDRVTISGVQDYHSFVTLLGLEVDLDDVQKVDFDPSNDVEEGDPVNEGLHHGHVHSGMNKAGSSKNPLGLQRTDSPTVMTPASTEPPSLKSRPSTSTRISTEGGHSTPPTSPGIDTPTKKFSLRNTLERAFTPGSHSREPSPTRKSTGPQWLDTTVPKPLAKATKLTAYDPTNTESQLDPESEYSFNIAVHTEQSWFVDSFQRAVENAHKRRYKDGVQRPKMIFNVAGYNCLMTDEELDVPMETPMSGTSDEEEEAEEEQEQEPKKDRTSLTVKATRKAEKTSMAAKVFGLDEADGIWRKSSHIHA